MLELNQRQLETEELSPRWNIGIDRRHVTAYVAIALIAGSAGGFLAGAYFARRQAPATALIENVRASARPTQPDPPPVEFHRVTRIVRADTLEVEGVGPVRMIGIETPDGKSPREIYSVHGQRALSFVEKAVLGQEVRLEFDTTPGSKSKDEQGQTLAYVYSREGSLINSEMVKQGLALVRSSEQFQKANDFRGYEREAMQSMRGVWGSSSSTLATAPPGTPASSSQTEDKTRKLAPLSPSALGANIPALSTSTPGEPGVWVSPSDRMYHKSACDFLDKKKKHSIGLSQAKSEGYTACSHCYASTVLKAP
jgi:micrococcal nuclease